MKKNILIILLIISMGTMYYFSSQDGPTSTAQSNTVIQVIDKIRDRVTLHNEKLIKINESIISELKKHKKSVVVRKAAHFSIYAVIGGLAMIVMYSFSKKVFLSATISFIFSILFAIFDERSQLKVDGRSGNLTDVFIDSSGALLSIILVSILLLIGKGLKFIFSKNQEI